MELINNNPKQFSEKFPKKEKFQKKSDEISKHIYNDFHQKLDFRRERWPLDLPDNVESNAKMETF